MFFSDMERKTLAITPLSLFFHLRGGAAFGSSKAFHCLLLLSCLLLSSVNTLHNLAEYDDSCCSNSYNTAATRFQGFNGGGDSESLSIQKSDLNACPSSHLFCFFLSENQFPLSCPNKSWSSSAITLSNNLSGVVWLSLKPVHIIEFQQEPLRLLNISPFSGFFHTACHKPLYTKKNTGGGVDHQWDSIKFLFFNLDLELSWSSGVAVFAVPMKATAPVLMLNLCKKPVFWVRTKRFSIALVIAAALLILLMFCFIDENNKRNNSSCSHIALRKAEITISPEMDSLLRSISKETLQVEVSKNTSIKPAAPVSTSTSQEEASEAVNLTVKTGKDKKRCRNKKKKKGGLNGLTPERTDVSSSYSGNSTPRSPLSPEPLTTTQLATVKPPKPVLSHSATFPASGVKSMIIQRSSLAPSVRAPGAKSRTQVKEEKSKEYRYDIWGDHLTGLNLMDRFKQVREGKRCSGFGEDESESFFVKGPQNLLPDSHARFVSFCNQWG